MLYEVVPKELYCSNSGYLFYVEGLARHGQDCSQSMVVYRNLEPTLDTPQGQLWVISEELFKKRFRTLEQYELEQVEL